MIKIRCQYCRYPIEVEENFYYKNNRVCCMSCNKAFDISKEKESKLMLTEEDIDALANESFNYDDDEY